jgi:predicted flap endonuclease-1-like 5' DNA nuclease
MRIDYLLYLFAAVFFITTAVSLVFLMDQMQRNLWVVTTVVLGLALIGLGYHQRRKATMEPVQSVQPIPQSEFAEAGNVNVKEANVEEKAQKPADPVPTEMATQSHSPNPQTIEKSVTFESDLTLVKGIGERRAAQLKELGINNLHELGKVSADDLAKDLGISPKITRKWVESAKESHK